MSNRPANRPDPMTTFHFFVDFEGSWAGQTVFTEVSGLGVEVMVQDYEEGGRNDHIHRLPGRVKVADITLRNGVTNSNDLWEWFKMILQGNFKRRNVSIVVVNQEQKEVQRWNLIKALPVKWTGPEFKSGQSTVAIQSLQLTHQGLEVT